MTEIGGYLGLESNSGAEYHRELMRFNTLRNALVFVIAQRGYKNVLIPHYLCDSVSDALRRHGIRYEYYSINQAFEPLIPRRLARDECAVIVNYFGRFSQAQIAAFKSRYGNIVIDSTQAFFSRLEQDIDCVYACRKYFGVPDGAYLSANLLPPLFDMLKTDASHMRMEHILGRYERPASDYYEAFQKNDALLAHLPVMKMSKLTQNLLKGIDYEHALDRRMHNFEALDGALSAVNEYPPGDANGYFMYPLFVRRGAALRRHLIGQKIYVPTLWPNVLEQAPAGSWEYRLADDLVPLPIDQRYGTDEMMYMAGIVKEWMEGEHDY